MDLEKRWNGGTRPHGGRDLRMLAVLRQRDFSFLWFGGVLSVVGDYFLFIALPFFVYERTGSALATGAMFAAETLPRLLFGSLAGVFVDRWDRKKTMIVADLSRAAILLPLLAVAAGGPVWLVYVVAFVEATLADPLPGRPRSGRGALWPGRPRRARLA